MRTNIKGTNIELTVAITNYVEQRLLTLDRFLKQHGDEVVCQIEVGKTTQHHKHGDFFRAEMNLKLKGGTLRAVAEKDDLYAAIDQVKDEMERQLTQGKEKRISLVRRGAKRIKDMVKGLYPGGN
ncbi:MAG: ribosome-associated translation inhibitor RaiA [Candidatus Paceibacterota bacterium]|jgi:putative sigma-54 modulation protein